jgi:uncharacterized protein YecE (DUF72 family)
MRGRILIGTCSWSQHAPFYPSELPKNQQIAFYAQYFPLVEIDSTFYTLVAERNFAVWAERTPPGFVFDVKPYRQLTQHDRDTVPEPLVFDMFRQSLQPLRDAGKLGVITFQFPPWFKLSPENLDYIEYCRDQFASDRLSLEFRHESWLTPGSLPDVIEFLVARRLGLTVVDEPQVGSASVPTVLAVTNPDLSVVRFHGRNAKTWYKKVENTGERFDYLYSDPELEQWVPNVSELAREAGEIHLLFNNNRANYAVRNAHRLTGILQESLPDIEVVAPASPTFSAQMPLF